MAPYSTRSAHQSQSGLELVSELSDLAAGAGILIFALAPFSLPALALTAVAAVALLVPALVGLVLAAPFLLARRWWRSGDRHHRLNSEAFRGAGEVR
jgi:hypothetical protein